MSDEETSDEYFESCNSSETELRNIFLDSDESDFATDELDYELNKFVNYLERLLDSRYDLKKINIFNRSHFLDSITGGTSVGEFILKLKNANNIVECKKEINVGSLKYKCHTCELEMWMDLCVDCFKNGDHEGHNYVLKHCNTPFICDCGNPNALKPENFCKQHKIATNSTTEPPPIMTKQSLNYIQILLSNLFYKILQFLRKLNDDDENSDDAFDPIPKRLRAIDPYLEFIMNFWNSDFTIRKLIVKYLLDEEFYIEKKEEENEKIVELRNYKVKLKHHKKVEERLKSVQTKVRLPSEFKDLGFLNIKIKNMLDEFLFSWIYFGTSDEIASCLLTIVKDSEVQEEFTKSFLAQYFLFDNNSMLNNKKEDSFVDLHNFKLFKIIQNACVKNFKELKLVETLLGALYNIRHQGIEQTTELIFSKTCKTFEDVIPITVFDLNEFLKIETIANYLIESEQLFSIWIDLVSMTQGMNNKFEEFTDEHSSVLELTFELENMECANMKNLILKSYKGEQNASLTIRALSKIEKNLTSWIKYVSINGNSNKKQLIFHLPLHRYYVGFIHKGLVDQNMTLNEILPNDEAKLFDLLRHPLKLQVCMREVEVGLWSDTVSLNEIIKQHVDYYTRYKYQFIDSDLFLIQSVACKLEPDRFVKTIFDEFRVFDICQNLLKIKENDENYRALDNKQEQGMLYGAFTLLAQIVFREITLDPNDKSAIKNEILQILCYDECTFSRIKSTIALGWYTTITDTEIEDILTEIADLVKPDYDTTTTLKNSYYTLKDEHWKETYDPLFFVYYRSNTDENGVTFNRFVNTLKSKNLVSGNFKPLPPYRLPTTDKLKNSVLKAKFNLVNCRTLHSVLFVLLYERFYYDLVDDKVFYLVIYMIELAINNIQYQDKCSEQEDFSLEGHFKPYSELDFGKWYASNNIFENLITIIPFINLERKNNSVKSKLTENDYEATEINHKYELIEDKIIVEESIMTLLVKILDKEKEKNQKFKFTNKINESRVGDVCYFLNNLLNKAASLNEKCKNQLNEILKTLEIETDSLKEDTLNDNLKERAFLKRQKTIESISKEQDKFLENAKLDHSLKRQISLITFDETIDEDPHAIDCSICHVTATPSIDRPVGLLCCIEPSYMSVFSESKNPLNIENLKNSRFSFEQKKIELLRESFTTESCKESVNICHKGSVFVKTCGHYSHFDCYFNTMHDNSNEFKCLICKKSANFLLPLKDTAIAKYKLLKLDYSNVDEDLVTSTYFIEKYLKTDYMIHPLVCIFIALLLSEALIDGLILIDLFQYLKTLMFCDNEAIQAVCATVAFEKRYIEINPNSKINADFNSMKDMDAILFLTSVIRHQLETYEMQKLTQKRSKFDRSCFLPLFDVLSTRCRLLSADRKPHLKAWNLLTQARAPSQTDPSIKREVPVLLRDPISMFLLIIMNWPSEFHRKIYQRIANSVFNLAYVQGVLTYVLKSSADQRSRFTLKKTDELKQFEDYCSFICNKLHRFLNGNKLPTAEQPTESDFQLEIEELIRPFLKVTSLLQSCLFNDIEEDDESFESLRNSLDIKYVKDGSKDVLEWFEIEPISIINSWIDDFLLGFDSYKEEIQTIFSIKIIKYKPQTLIELPHLLADLYTNHNTSNFSICLICGDYLDYDQDDFDNHIKQCEGLFLSFDSCCVFLYTEGELKKWGTIYLDKHGEEDFELERDEAMYLSKERYKLLKELWLNKSLNEYLTIVS